MFNLSIAILALSLGLVACISDSQSSPENVPEVSTNHQPPIPFQGLNQADQPIHGERMFKRSPSYDFGLGKRAYSYVSEYKRLPVYNFGLGKRARTYSFGLGKRSVDVNSAPDYEDDSEDFKGNFLDENDSFEDWLDQYDDGSYPPLQEKRSRVYSFGLGKRYYQESENEAEKRRPRLYEFGLGKRVPRTYSFGLGKRNPRTYSFGLGKRLPRTYSFGLGKRQRLANRFNFGLGKRSVDNVLENAEMNADSDSGIDTEI